MAATYTLCCPGVTCTAASTRMLDILNADGTKLVKIYRIKILTSTTTSSGTGAGTFTATTGTSSPYGVPSLFGAYRSTGTATGGTAITTTFASGRGIAVMDSSSAAPTNLTVMTNATGGSTVDYTTPFFIIARSNDEMEVNGALTLDGLGTIPVLNIFDCGYGDSNLEPITLRQNQGLTIASPSIGAYVASYNVDIFVELTFA